MKKIFFLSIYICFSCSLITDFYLPTIEIISPSDADTLVSFGQLRIRIEMKADDNTFDFR